MNTHPVANVLVFVCPLEPNVKTVVGICSTTASTIIMYPVHRMIMSPFALTRIRCNLDQRTTDCPVTIGHQPIVINVIAAHLALPVVMSKRLRRKPIV